MQLAKPALDVGLYTNNLDEMLTFWQNQAHATFTEMLPVGGGVRQHRHAVGNSVIKINHTRQPIAPGRPTGLSQVEIFTPSVQGPSPLTDPDDNKLCLSPPNARNTNLSLSLVTPNLSAQQDFYGGTLGFKELSPTSFAVGASTVELVEGDLASFERAGLGYRYMTFQVFDVVSEHAYIVNHGGKEGMAPVRLGDVAYISFVLDHDRNWLEISQRKSITGSLD